MTELTERELLERQLHAVLHNHGPHHKDVVRPEHAIAQLNQPPKLSWWQRVRSAF